MLEPNAFVVYGANGICRVDGIREEAFNGKKQEYFVLKPIDSEGATINVPTDSEVLTGKMKKLLRADEVEILIRNMPNEETIWIDDDRLCNEAYRAILSKGDRTELVRLTKTLYRRKKELSAKGKRLRSTDEQIMRQAESLLFNELAMVLEIERNDVLDFIYKKIGGESE